MLISYLHTPDAEWKDFYHAAKFCVSGSVDRKHLMTQISRLWMTAQNYNPVLITISVRTAFDLYLRVMNFPSGSEVIVSAINIPGKTDEVVILGLKHHIMSIHVHCMS